MNPQTDFDEDWAAEEWGSGPAVTSPIAGNQSSLSWGVANVRKLTQPGATGGLTVEQPDVLGSGSRKPFSRGRGHLRKTENAPAPGSSSAVVNTAPEPTHKPHERAIVGRTPESEAATQISNSVFSFRTMVSSLPQNSSVSAAGDGASTNFAPTPATGFSFREAASTINSNTQETRNNAGDAFGDWNEATPQTAEGNAGFDAQMCRLESVLSETSVPLGAAHERKLAALRQDPNHPLYSVTTFESMDLKVQLKEGLSADRKCKLSAIQEKTLPALNSSPYRNCIAQSQNGTGKTVAFVVTMLNRVDFAKPCVQALCLLPTKELAQQVVETTKKLGRFFQGIDQLVHSAIRDSKHPNMTSAIRAIEHAELNAEGKIRAPIVVGTAGTVNTLMRKTKQLDFNGLVLFVVDEADKMLDYSCENFLTTISNISRRLPDTAQRVFFSATFSDQVIDEAKRHMTNPLVIRLKDEDLSLDNIRHFYMKVKDRNEKLSAMKKIYNAMTVGQSIVFCRTRSMAHWLSTELRSQLDFKVAELCGDMEAHTRDEQISRFRRSADRVLVTTNLSARGLDISSVNLIINWDPPVVHETKQADFDTYLHRVGRSGRFGADGIAVNMVESHQDLRLFQQIEQHFGIQVENLSSSYDEMERMIRQNRD